MTNEVETIDVVPPEQCKSCSYGYEEMGHPTVAGLFLWTIQIGRDYKTKVMVQKCERERAPERIGALLKIYLAQLKRRGEDEAAYRGGERHHQLWGEVGSPKWERGLKFHLDSIYGKKPEPCGWFKSKMRGGFR